MAYLTIEMPNGAFPLAYLLIVLGALINDVIHLVVVDTGHYATLWSKVTPLIVS